MKVVEKIGATEPLSLETVKNYLRIDHTDDDALLAIMITAARETAEAETNRALIRQKLSCVIESPGISEEIPRPPYLADSLTVSGATIDRIDTGSDVARVYFAQKPTEPVTLEWTCGFDSSDAVPAKIKQAMLLLIAHWYDNRQLVGAPGVQVQEIPFVAGRLFELSRVQNV